VAGHGRVDGDGVLGDLLVLGALLEPAGAVALSSSSWVDRSAHPDRARTTTASTHRHLFKGAFIPLSARYFSAA